MFGHDDKPKDEDNHDEDNAIATDTDQVVRPDDHGDNASDWQHPGTPLKDDSQADKTDDFTTGHDDNTANNPSAGQPYHPTPAPHDGNDDLIDIKQEALGKLSPLIGHLDQSPDEKFRTLMMMIQASDDQGLVKQAYDTALKIEDEKTRAQALLDIVNEINYFTQNPAKPA
jgi:hypothetical protein